MYSSFTAAKIIDVKNAKHISVCAHLFHVDSYLGSSSEGNRIVSLTRTHPKYVSEFYLTKWKHIKFAELAAIKHEKSVFGFFTIHRGRRCEMKRWIKPYFPNWLAPGNMLITFLLVHEITTDWIPFNYTTFIEGASLNLYNYLETWRNYLHYEKLWLYKTHAD